MAKTHWTIRNYNAFLRAVRSKHGLSLRQARQVYRATKISLGHSLRGTDSRHKVTVKAAIRVRRQKPAAPPKPIQGKSPRKRSSPASGGAGGSGADLYPKDFFDLDYDYPEYDIDDAVDQYLET